MNLSRNQKVGLILILIFVLFLFVGEYKTRIIREKISKNKNHIIMCVKIINSYVRKGVYCIEFQFIYNGKTYGTGFLNEIDISSKNYYNKYQYGMTNIMIIFNKDDPSSFQLIEDYSDFKKYNITINDTLGINCPNCISTGTAHD